MAKENPERQQRAMINVALVNVPDQKVIELKSQIEQLLDDLPDAMVDVRMGSGRAPPSPPGPSV